MAGKPAKEKMTEGAGRLPRLDSNLRMLGPGDIVSKQENAITGKSISTEDQKSKKIKLLLSGGKAIPKIEKPKAEMPLKITKAMAGVYNVENVCNILAGTK